jgi:hypothetical protein
VLELLVHYISTISPVWLPYISPHQLLDEHAVLELLVRVAVRIKAEQVDEPVG